MAFGELEEEWYFVLMKMGKDMYRR